MIVRELISRFGFQVDKDQFQKAESGFSKLKSVAGALVGVLVAGKVASAIRGIVTETAAAADMFDKMSKRVGISTDALQEYDFVARLAGTSAGEFEIGIRRLQRSMDEAAQGVASYADDFKRLGIRLRDSEGKMRSVEDILPEMGDSFKGLETDTERVALAQALLGRSGTSLLPVLLQGTAAIKEQRAEARELGFMDEKLIALGVDYTDISLRMTKATEGVKNVIAKALLPGLIKTKKAVIEWYLANREWLNQKLTQAIKAIGVVFDSVYRIVKTVAGVIRSLVSHFYDLGKQLSVANPLLFKVAVLMAAVAAAILLPISPMILFMIMAGLIADDLILWWEEGDKANTAMGRLDKTLGGNLSQIKEMTKQTGKGGPAVLEWAEIWDGAMMSMGESMDEWFVEFKQTWFDIKQMFFDTIKEIKVAFSQLWFDIKQMFFDTIKEIKVAFSQLWFDISKGTTEISPLDWFFGGGKRPDAEIEAFNAASGAAAAPAVAMSSPRAGGSLSQSASVSVNVQPPPGGSPEQYGNIISKMVSETLSDVLRQTGRANSTATP